MLYKSIRFKITLAFSSVFTLIFLISGFFIYQKTKANIINADNQELFSRAEILASKTDVSPVVIPLPNKEELIKIDYLIGKLTKNLFTSLDFPKIDNLKPFPNVLDLADKRVAFIEVNLNQTDSEKIRFFITKPNQPLKKEINTLFYTLFLSNLLSIITSASLSYVLAGFLLQPINNIIKTTKKINASQKMALIEVPETNDEIQMLSETINEMLKRIENTLNEQNNFFASASHELKTPLTILKTEIEVNLKEKNLNTDLKKFFNSQLEEVSRLSRLIEDFLLVTQLNSQNLNLRFKTIELDEIIFDVIHKLNNLLNLSGLTLNLELDEAIDNFSLKADPDKLLNIFINLIENAIKYASAKSEIKVILKEDKNLNEFIIEISNKIDQPLNNIDKLTDQFYRADVLKDGYGLGLWISNKIINLHKGKLDFLQENESFLVKVFLPR